MNDDLIIKYLLREASPEEESQFRKWISASRENEEKFSRFKLIWDTSKTLEQQSAADPEVAWGNFKARVSKTGENEIPVRFLGQRYAWLTVAAVLFIVAGVWSFYSVFNSGYYTIEAGELVRTEILPDGSEVTLNKNTSLSYRRNFKGGSRRVKLEDGEAFFNVSPDKSKPFVIEADDVTVTVVGTSFNVKHNKGSTEVIVETGLVQVSMGKQMIGLKRGEKVFVTDKNSTLRIEANTDQLHNYYRSKLFVADNTPLWRVVEILNEAYNSDIVIGNAQIKDLRLTTTFKDDSLDNIINVITQTFKIKAVKKDGKIILR